jgi:hypothetical protein
VGECEADQAVVAVGHLADHLGAHGLLGSEPREVERLLRGLAVTFDRHHVGEADRVVAGIVETGPFGFGKYSTTVNGVGLAGTRGSAIGPRSFSQWRISASRTRSPNNTRPVTTILLIEPSEATRSSMPTLVTLPSESTRTGTASTYTIGTWARTSSRSSGDNHPVEVSVSASWSMSFTTLMFARVRWLLLAFRSNRGV